MARVKNTVNTSIASKKIRASVGLYADTAAKKMEGEAKRGRLWTDRTAVARNSIQGNYHWKGNKCYIVLSGNVEYFVFLELAMEKRYAILYPTLLRKAPEILRGYQRLVKK